MKECPNCSITYDNSLTTCMRCGGALNCADNLKEPLRLAWVWWTIGVSAFIMLMISGLHQKSNSDLTQQYNQKVSQNLIKSDVQVRIITSKLYQTFEKKIIPEQGYLYQLKGMRVMQKVNNGYLLSADSDERSIQEPVLLYTDRNMPRDWMIFQGWASYVGDVEYVTLSGYPKRVHAFKLYEEEPPVVQPYPH
jgi:hypothetical protein